MGTAEHTVYHIQALGNINILKSYLLLVWSEWSSLWCSGFHVMYTSIRQDFSGIGMQCHRRDLIKRLDHVLGQLDLGLEYLRQHKPSLRERDFQCAK